MEALEKASVVRGHSMMSETARSGRQTSAVQWGTPVLRWRSGDVIYEGVTSHREALVAREMGGRRKGRITVAALPSRQELLMLLEARRARRDDMHRRFETVSADQHQQRQLRETHLPLAALGSRVGCGLEPIVQEVVEACAGQMLPCAERLHTCLAAAPPPLVAGEPLLAHLLGISLEPDQLPTLPPEEQKRRVQHISRQRQEFTGYGHPSNEAGIRRSSW